ncbi:MAG TPA: Mur ligase family protein, partial [Chloroflexota bacterium]|nr:Mur ligase family protein [Chloroflexota bacterium]
MSEPDAEKTFSLGDLAAWQRDGDQAKPVPAHERRHVFSTVTHSSLPDGSPPMRAGGLFVAFRARRDGHDFAANAFANGARAALVNRLPDNLTEALARGRVHVLRPGAALPADSAPLLVLVDDTLAALQRCASWWRRQHRARVLALTGSVGKTTTKDLLTQILGQRGRVLSTRGNYNNEFGLPFMLLELTEAHTHAVLEIGISAVGEMQVFAG